MSKDAQENYEATLKAAEEKWENFKKAITDYDTLVGDTIPGIESAITDAAYDWLTAAERYKEIGTNSLIKLLKILMKKTFLETQKLN